MFYLVSVTVVSIAVIVLVFARVAAQRQHRLTMLASQLHVELARVGIRATYADGVTLIIAATSTLTCPLDRQLDEVDEVVYRFVKTKKAAINIAEPNDGSLCHLTVYLPDRVS